MASWHVEGIKVKQLYWLDTSCHAAWPGLAPRCPGSLGSVGSLLHTLSTALPRTALGSFRSEALAGTAEPPVQQGMAPTCKWLLLSQPSAGLTAAR